jgi:4-hydroxy-tetrahydrodipicolinate synthase
MTDPTNSHSSHGAQRLPHGSYPAMLTAFLDDGQIDWEGVDRLTDFCIDHSAAGIFACGLSAEVGEMNDEEKGALAERIVRHAAGRVPMVVGAITSGSIEQQATLARRVHDAGADVVAIAVCQLANEDEDDQQWIANAESLLEKLPAELRLSMYECPWPYHRLLSLDMLRWAAGTRRFHFMKDTCCTISTIRDRLTLLQDSPLQLLNANTATLLASLQAGADGFCGIGANYLPKLYAWLCQNYSRQPQQAAALQDFLASTVPLTESPTYPALAKEYLRQQGLKIGTYSRKLPAGLAADGADQLAQMRRNETEWLERVQV